MPVCLPTATPCDGAERGFGWSSHKASGRARSSALCWALLCDMSGGEEATVAWTSLLFRLMHQHQEDNITPYHTTCGVYHTSSGSEHSPFLLMIRAPENSCFMSQTMLLHVISSEAAARCSQKASNRRYPYVGRAPRL